MASRYEASGDGGTVFPVPLFEGAGDSIYVSWRGRDVAAAYHTMIWSDKGFFGFRSLWGAMPYRLYDGGRIEAAGKKSLQVTSPKWYTGQTMYIH